MNRLLHARRRSSGAPASLLAALLLLSAGCGNGSNAAGGGTAGGGSGPAPFVLLSTSVAPGQIWQINREIELVFSNDVDFATVSSSTIPITRADGLPATGTFSQDVADLRVIRFQPSCPARPDLMDAGLRAGGFSYTLLVPDVSGGIITVQDTTGQSLTTGGQVDFQTPATRDPLQLFFDPVPGPPTPVLRTAPGQPGTHLVFGGDETAPEFFEVDPFGVGRLASGAVAPLNLYSDPASGVELVLELDQPVSPKVQNISPERLWLEFDADPSTTAEDWRRLSGRVELLANCSETGATLRLSVDGALPQDRELRAVLSPAFTDLVGEAPLVPFVDFAHFRTDFAQDGAGAPIETADELREEFSGGSFEDGTRTLPWPRARWTGDRLEAEVGFAGTGGPGGDFDWHLPPSTTFVLDTTSSVILGGPGGVPTTTQTVIGGVVDVRDLFIPETSVLAIQGPNPVVILCTGTARIDGEISVDGRNAAAVATLNQPQIPELGAPGTAGGGRGGTGSWNTTSSTPRGGQGFGAFDSPLAGGQGGESGWSPDPSSAGANRRAAGGGGGRFGHDQILAGGCPEQGSIGLDAESGFPGSPAANSAIRLGQTLPWGGHAARVPFHNPNDTAAEREDDFFGVMRADFETAPHLVRGELERPWAGSGGGAGGDATQTDSYPPSAFVFSHEDKGAGGGGGGGSLSLLALGDIVLGPNADVHARGGHGGGGENTLFTNHIGGGSGGGSGGHLILQTAARLDLSAAAGPGPVLDATGGQGGAGENDDGGAGLAGETLATLDSIHDGNGPPSDNPWDPSGCPGPQNVLRRAAGGDGGPGLVQLHVPDPRTSILYPDDVSDLAALSKPAPVGYDHVQADWKHHLLPSFGAVSAAQSKWIPLGAVHAAPGSSSPDPVAFLFGGLDARGRVRTVGGAVVDLPPLAVTTVGTGATVAPDLRTLRLDVGLLAPGEAFYLANPHLLERSYLVMTNGRFEVQAASHDGAAGELVLSVDSAGPPLATSGQVRLVPRHFAVRTDGAVDRLPAPMKVRVQLQATTADALGAPDPAAVVPSPGFWTSDPADLNASPQATALRFYRFRVTFDLGQPPALGAPLPSLEFLRVPFRF